MAAVFAGIWMAAHFGVVDLLVVPTQDEGFFDHYLLETGWGLLFTFLIPLPLLLWSITPTWRPLMQQVVVTAIGLLTAGLAAWAPLQVLTAAFVVACAWVPSRLAGQPLWPVAGLSGRAPNRWIGGLAMAAAAAGITYAISMIMAAHSGDPDETSLDMLHLPVQAGFGLAVGGTALVTASASGANAAGWRAAALTPALSAVWLGVVSALYPDHLASLGRLGGATAVAWGVAFGLLAFTRHADK